MDKITTPALAFLHEGVVIHKFMYCCLE